MIQRLLVPLDGSELSEKILPIVVFFARAFHATVHLIHVIEKNAPSQIHQHRHLTTQTQADDYLKEITQRLNLPSDSVKIHVHTDMKENVTQSIVSHAEREIPSDLIIMCTHGHGGVGRFLFGSIAQQVASSGMTPILFVKPSHEIPNDYKCTKIVVPLDLTMEHESGFNFAMDIAQVCAAELFLMSVVPIRSKGKWSQVERLLPSASARAFDVAVEQAQEYISDKMNAARQRSIIVHGDVFRGEPAKEIVETAQRKSADLIVMGTHGTLGMDAYLEGSVATEVSQLCTVPVLMVPVKI